MYIGGGDIDCPWFATGLLMIHLMCGDRLGSGHPQKTTQSPDRLNKAPKHYTKTQNIIQRPKILDKTFNENMQRPKILDKHHKY